MQKYFLLILALANFLSLTAYQSAALAQIPVSEGYPWEKIENSKMGVSIEVPTLGKVIHKRKIEATYMRVEISEATENDPFNYDYILEIYSGPADSLKIIERLGDCKQDIRVNIEEPLSFQCTPKGAGSSSSFRRLLLVFSMDQEFIISLGDRNIDKQTSDMIIQSFKLINQ
ncbi:MAG: hypothetical protein JJ971_07935 [Balneolaceae bacterium]|nr:hypothetical protein [Balneolaceae bacterium]MBO6546834.1 hypothetical protein [Balneolaceae bacterium]MBO6649194.1 hypothetical protein [Balneolaceae bacterium]